MQDMLRLRQRLWLKQIRAGQHQIRAGRIFSVNSADYNLRRRAKNLQIRQKRHPTAVYQRRTDIFQLRKISNLAIIGLRQQIKGRLLAHVGGRGNHRLTGHAVGLTPALCNLARQLVSAAQMAGQQANRKMRLLVQHHYRRVLTFMHHIRRKSAKHNAGRHNHHKTLIAAINFGY